MNPVGSYFAQAARLEAASVTAFRVLAGELAGLGAPARLVRAAQRSASDEIRHTDATASMARRYSEEPIRATVGVAPQGRSLEAIAIENAVEGCVRETYGATVALWQSRLAKDPVVAASMAPIAADEARHADLAWEVALWAEGRLSSAARRRVVSARAQALEDLTIEAAQPIDDVLVALAGLPAADCATALLRGLENSVLGPAGA